MFGEEEVPASTFAVVLLLGQMLRNLSCVMHIQVMCWQISKQNEKMYTLLAICLVLHPMRIDESVHSQLREKFADKMLRLQKGWVCDLESNGQNIQ